MRDSETWLPIRCWEGIYEVSNHGNVRRIKEGKGTRGPNHVLQPSREKTGYLFVKLRFNGRLDQIKVHKLVMQTFVGLRPDGFEINHIDGNPANNRLTNLEYCTSSQNKFHAYIMGRSIVSCTGSSNGRSKLKESDVIKIRERYTNGGITQQKLADEYGVNQTMIGFIVRRASWPHL